MLIHRTDDVAARALDIAHREAERVWTQTGDYDLWAQTLVATEHEALAELCGHFPTKEPGSRN